VLIPFEKKLPSTDIKTFLVTPEVVDNPESELEKLLKNPYSAQAARRFEKASNREFENIKNYILGRVDEFYRKSGLDIYERRAELIALLYLNNFSDINSAFDDFREMHELIKAEESSLVEKLEVNVLFDEGAVDELINQAIETGHDVGFLALQLAERLEYGLKLVKEKSGIESFVIDNEAVTNMDNFVSSLVKKFYRQE
jgi:hypothetical protein